MSARMTLKQARAILAARNPSLALEVKRDGAAFAVRERGATVWSVVTIAEMLPMTHAQALAEARARWGPRAVAVIGVWSHKCRVGLPLANGVPIAGVGETWEAAFADADASVTVRTHAGDRS